MVMFNDSVLLRLGAQVPEDIGSIEVFTIMGNVNNKI